MMSVWVMVDIKTSYKHFPTTVGLNNSPNIGTVSLFPSNFPVNFNLIFKISCKQP